MEEKKDYVWLCLTKMDLETLKQHMAQGSSDLFYKLFSRDIHNTNEDEVFSKAKPGNKDYWIVMAEYELLVVKRVAHDVQIQDKDFLVERVLMIEEALEFYGLSVDEIFELMKRFVEPLREVK